jgi:rhodanese-related sulfurtransferase
MQDHPPIPGVDVEEVGELVADGALLVDIREPEEWDEARIAGAELKPMSAINDWWQDLPSDRTVILYCRSGQRSARAVHALTSQAQLDNVFDMRGGIIAWHEAGLPVEG